MDDTPYDDDDEIAGLRGRFLAEASASVAFDPDVTAIVGTISKHLDAAATASSGAMQRTRQLAADDLTPKEGRDRLAREAMEGGKSKANAALEQADLAIDVLTKSLRSKALPKAPSERAEDHARQELQLVLSASKDPLSDLLRIAAGTDDAMAAVAVGRLGRSLLAARGQADDHEAVIDAAVAAAASSSNPERRKAGEALRSAVIAARKAKGAVNAAVMGQVGGLGR